MRQPLVIGNWKMHGSVEMAGVLAQACAATAQTLRDQVKVVICPPFPYLPIVAVHAGTLMIGAQDCSAFVEGAHTGEVSAPMLHELGCEWVIVGHSERRESWGESDQLVVEKAQAALSAGLRAVVCVGEPLSVREQGEVAAQGFVIQQLEALLDSDIDAALWERLVIAYEPIWAIGSGLTASPEQAQAMHARIRSLLAERWGEALAQRIPLLYGGSVKPDNAAALFGKTDIDGGLIGGASLNADSFAAICAAAG